MGSQICNPTPDKEETLNVTSGIYLSDPRNISRTQIRSTEGRQIAQTCNQFIDLDQTSIFLGCKSTQNRKLLNKYMLTYLYFLKSKPTDAQIEIKDFSKLMKIFDENQQHTIQIQFFQSQYLLKRNPREKFDLLINQYFKNGFFSNAIEKFPIYSSDPSILGYVRRPLIDLNKGIKSKYEQQDRIKEIYCVIQVSQKQERLLNEMSIQQDYFTFGTFIRCFSDEQNAKKRQKQLFKIGKNIIGKPSTLFFNIQIPDQQVDRDYDYGFYQDESQKENPLGDIIMNILNFFQVTGAEPQQKTFNLKYNGLARNVHLRRARMLNSEPELLKVITLIENKCLQINSHSSLLRTVMNTRLSITASQTMKNAVNLNQSNEDNQRINLIEAYLEERDFDKALLQCKNTPQFKVRKAQIYYEAMKYQQAQNTLRQIETQKETLKRDFFKEYVLYEFISAKLKKQKGEKKAAEKQLRKLSETMKKQYRGSYEFRGRQLEKQIAQFEGVTNSTALNWQDYSDGLNISLMLSH